MSTTIEAAARPADAAARPRGGLALALQEAFTAAIRLRANRQVAADADSFRAHIKQLLGIADAEARRLGYDGGQVKYAVYAYIAFLDESVLNSPQPMFADWPRQPLQEEIFGDHMAGETFFRHLDSLLAQQDSDGLADVLEVYQLCLLLGFRGKYGSSAQDGLPALSGALQDKIQRIRGGPLPFSPAWALPADESVPELRDPWVPRLAAAAAGCFVLAGVLFLVFRLLLRSDVVAVQSLISQLIR